MANKKNKGGCIPIVDAWAGQTLSVVSLEIDCLG